MHTSLSDVNRRLAQLEAQLLGGGDLLPDDGAPAAAGRFAAAGAEPVPPAVAPAIAADEQEGVQALRAQIDDLLALRTVVAGTLRDVIRQCEAALAGLRGPAAPAPQPAPSRAAEAPSATLQGTVLLTAGPFAHIGEVGELERALIEIAAVALVSLVGLEGDHAVLALTLSRPARLVDDMRARLPIPFAVTEAEPGRVAIVFVASEDAADEVAAAVSVP